MIANNKIVPDFNTAFSYFLTAIAEDARIGPIHICLYISILYCYKQSAEQVPISVYSKQLMKQAKISSACTYHRYMLELHKYGYIHYIPSYNPMFGSLIYPLKLGQNEYCTRNSGIQDL